VAEVALSFTSIDHVPLRMEAHQLLDHAVDLSCCGAIQVAISNADRYPGSITLELVLTDLTGGSNRSLTLGIAEVDSWPHRGSLAEVQPASEVLNFPVPSHNPLMQFDEITIIFHFDGIRKDTSARIALEKFLLIPRS
jgi:hypothetical protein